MKMFLDFLSKTNNYCAGNIFADETGDVPGWVMVTLMTAGLVVALSAIALPALTALFNNAIASVTNI